MRKIIVHEFITLDGVIQAPGGVDEDRDGGFVHGSWTLPYWDNSIGEQFFKTMQEADALLLGRKTWVTHGEAFNPMTNDPFADAMNAIQKYVVSTTLETTDIWRNSILIKENVVEEVKKLKEAPGKNILIDGSSVLLHTLIENGLVDEFQLHVYPISLGGGKKLFPENVRVNLKLLESRALSTGVIFQHYSLVK